MESMLSWTLMASSQCKRSGMSSILSIRCCKTAPLQ